MRDQFEINRPPHPAAGSSAPNCCLPRKGDLHGVRLLSLVGLELHRLIEVAQEPLLAGQNLGTTGIAVTWQNVDWLQSDRLVQNDGPISDIGVQKLVSRPVDGCIAGAKDSLLRQPDVSVSRGMAQPRKETAPRGICLLL